MNVLIPKHINDVTLEQYQRFALINNEAQDAEFFIHKTIEIFCDVDIRTVSKFPLKDAKEISQDIIDVLNNNIPFTDRFEMGGVKYGFIPDLQKISLGEFIDLEEALKDSKTFHQAAAVMFRPIVKEYKELYTIETYEASAQAAQDMKQAPIGVISAAIVFFYNIVNELLAVSQVYSKSEKETAQIILEKANLQQNMVGSTQFTHYVEVLRQNLEKLQE